MTRVRLLALLALLFVTPALAQVMQVQRIQRPIQITPLPAPQAQQEADLVVNTMTLEEARKKIFDLYRERRELNAKLNEATATIEQMTSRGGSLVRAYCESESVSRNTAGATESCSRYKCGEVDGLCKKSCSTSNDCLGETRCSDGQCLTLAEVQAKG